MTIEQRTEPRKKTFLKGRVLFNGGASSMDCLVRDLSAHGARLELTDTAILPEVFDLYILHKDATFRSKLRWRRDGSFGITFDDPNRRAEAAPAPDPAALDVAALQRRIVKLEAENATLRSLIASGKPQAAEASAP